MQIKIEAKEVKDGIGKVEVYSFDEYGEAIDVDVLYALPYNRPDFNNYSVESKRSFILYGQAEITVEP